MARKSDAKTSSYDRIFDAITRSSRWRSYMESIRTDFEKVDILEYTFSHHSNYADDNNYVVEARFHIGPVLDVKVSFDEDSALFADAASANQIDWTINKFFSDEKRMNGILEGLFDTKGYPTFNCTLDNAKKKWSDFAKKRISDELHPLKDSFHLHVVAQKKSIMASEGFIRDKQRYYDLLVINDIREVVQKFYKKVSPEVIKEALDNVIVHDICEI